LLLEVSARQMRRDVSRGEHELAIVKPEHLEMMSPIRAAMTIAPLRDPLDEAGGKTAGESVAEFREPRAVEEDGDEAGCSWAALATPWCRRVKPGTQPGTKMRKFNVTYTDVASGKPCK
jgi:hypothetical protein